MSDLLDPAFEYLCAQRFRVMLLFSLCTLGLIITVGLIFYFPSGTGTFVISVINLVALVPLVGASGYVLYACDKRYAP